ncbi:MAG TPA: hypothetical protein IGS52_16480 [Oscillatoriaceae cyanobacterium M33_DOE_052]|uniref:Uncharacterized protein n=1 Tax=Planktothricoides sp. SpSt-374 TaxID=2282167 RepID=A0A7C3ZNX4_9CYAN|nr:hypothetical protein [Oscillatoriaceae cyanobacterium M33_DOE_052]
MQAIVQLEQLHILDVARTEVICRVNHGEITAAMVSPIAALLPKSQTPHPFILLFLTTFSSFVFGFIPITFGLSLSGGPEQFLLNRLSGSIIAEKNSPGNIPEL